MNGFFCRREGLKGKHLVMNSLFRTCLPALLPRASHLALRSESSAFFAPSCNINYTRAGSRAANLKLLLTSFRVQCYSSKANKKKKSASEKKKSASEPVMKEDKEAFFVVRKGDIVGVYKSLNECQSQVGSSVCNPIPNYMHTYMITGSIGICANFYFMILLSL